ADPKRFANPVTGAQAYGGSRGGRDHLQMLRKAAGSAREMLMQAAPAGGGVPGDQGRAQPGGGGQPPPRPQRPYAQLVDRAQQLPIPQNPTLKTPDQFRYIGKVVHRVDVAPKVSGQAIYGMDVKVTGMLVASIERCPVVSGGKVTSVDATAA